MRWTCLRSAACLAIVVVPTVQGQPSIISGRVFDSLRMGPLIGASVTLSGTALATRTGADGAYRLVTELRGRRTLTFSEPRLDRLLGTVVSEVELVAGREVRVDFSIPRRRPTPSELCTSSSPRATTGGAVVGVVRDSSTRLPISGALVAAYWISESPDTAGAHRGLKGESGEDGGFLLCNLPTDRVVSLLSRTQGRALILEGLRARSDGILDVDLLLQALTERAAAGQLHGRVLDSATGEELAGADVMLLESGLHAISNTTGDFAIDQVLPGRTVMVVRRIGYRPQFLEAAVEAGATARVVAVLPPAPFRLADLETRVAGVLEREGFFERQKNGIGKYWDEAEIRRFEGRTVTSLLGGKASIREDKGVLMNFSRNRNCPIPVVVDGVLWVGSENSGVAAFFRPAQLAAVEYYSGPAQVPMEFQSLELRVDGFRCGLLVIWTRGRS